MNHKIFDNNTKGNDYVVGDIHGCVTELYQALTEVNFDVTLDRLFSVGDLMDRGPENLEISELVDQPWFHFTKANHDIMALEALSSEQDAAYWLNSGGLWAIDVVENYGISFTDADLKFANIIEKIKAAPDVISVKKTDGTYFHVCHTLFKIPYFVRTFADFSDYISMAGHDREFYWNRGPLRKYNGIELTKENINKMAIDYGYNNLYPNLFYIGHTTMLHSTTYFKWVTIDTGACFREIDNRYGFTLGNPNTNEYWQNGKQVKPIRLDRL
jgi:hypothetical protein